MHTIRAQFYVLLCNVIVQRKGETEFFLLIVTDNIVQSTELKTKIESFKDQGTIIKRS